ncbi:MAG: DUF1653 domain-containing protein [Nanoarchaeota archaeon]|nr:DUF1653 domain-containing protein [Nanoarchaeota archaeon]
MDPIPGDKYQHYKGNIYEIIGIGRHTETDETVVVYRALSGDHSGQIWVRPKAMFFDEVIRDGINIPRFRRIE